MVNLSGCLVIFKIQRSMLFGIYNQYHMLRCIRQFIIHEIIFASMPEVLIIMGSKSDLPIAEKAVDIFKRFDIDYKVMIASAHRTPSRV